MAVHPVIPGGATSRAELLARARRLKSVLSEDLTNPYKRPVGELNEAFIQQVESRSEPTLGEILRAVEAEAAADRRKARWATLGGLALALGGVVGGGMVGLPGLARVGMMLGGFLLASRVGGAAAAQAMEADSFSRVLSDWGRAIAAENRQQAAAPASAPQPPAASTAA